MSIVFSVGRCIQLKTEVYSTMLIAVPKLPHQVSKMQRVILTCCALVVVVSGLPNTTTTPLLPSTPPILTTSTTKPTTIPRSGCFYNGNWYPPGSDISRGSDGKSWCYGMYCDHLGQTVVWDNFRCNTKTSSSISTTIPETSTTLLPNFTHRMRSSIPTATINTRPTIIATLTTMSKSGCFYNGKWYPPGSDIIPYTSNVVCGNSIYCDQLGRILIFDFINCPSKNSNPITSPQSSSFTTNYYSTITTTILAATITAIPTATITTPTIIVTPTTMSKSGCFYDGKWYLPGSDISRGFDGKSWCYGTYCDQSGQIVAWDNFRCTTSTPLTTPESLTTLLPSSTRTTKSIPTATTTTTTTRTPTTTPKSGCFYNGKWYPPGSDISRGFDGKSWCYGLICDKSGQILAWDNFRCSTKTSTTPTTIPNHTPQGQPISMLPYITVTVFMVIRNLRTLM